MILRSLFGRLFGKSSSRRFKSNLSGSEASVLEIRVLLDGYGYKPTASFDSYWTYHDDSFTVGGIFENDDMGMSDSGTTFAITQSTSHGTLTPSGGGYFWYTPATGYVGLDSFEYQLSNSFGSSSATVEISVSNSVPIAGAVDTTAGADPVEWRIDVLNQCMDNEGDPMHIATVTQPENGGSVRIDNSGFFVWYTPPSEDTLVSETSSDDVNEFPATASSLGVTYETLGAEAGFANKFYYTVADDLNAKSELAVVNMAEERSLRWVQSAISTSSSQAAIDGNPGVALFMKQTLRGSNAPLANKTQLWQLNYITAAIGYIGAGGIAKLSSGSWVGDDVVDYSGKKANGSFNKDKLGFVEPPAGSPGYPDKVGSSFFMYKQCDKMLGLNTNGITRPVGVRKSIDVNDVSLMEMNMGEPMSTSVHEEYLYINRTAIEQLHGSGGDYDSLLGDLSSLGIYYPDLPQVLEVLVVHGLAGGTKVYQYVSDSGPTNEWENINGAPPAGGPVFGMSSLGSGSGTSQSANPSLESSVVLPGPTQPYISGFFFAQSYQFQSGLLTMFSGELP